MAASDSLIDQQNARGHMINVSIMQLYTMVFVHLKTALLLMQLQLPVQPFMALLAIKTPEGRL